MSKSQTTNGHQEPAPFNIAIIGAGLVGLPIALGLIYRNIPVTIYEQTHALKEIGAGIGISGSGKACLNFLDPKLAETLETVANKSPTGYQCIDGFSQEDVRLRPKDKLFDMVYDTPGGGAYLCHRAQLLAAMIDLVSPDRLKLGKRVDTITRGEDNEKMVIKFCDGTSAEADGVIGCDGIKSRVRQIIAGIDNPASYPRYAHESAYRCLVDMDEAFPVLGHLAKRQILFAGHGAHIMAYPVADFKYLNVAAFVRDSGDWPHDQKHTVSANKDDIVDSFSRFGPYVRDLVKLLPDELNRWGMFDTLDHPLSSFTNGRITLAGDAAHGTTPHVGYGAGMGIEDATVLTAVLEQAAMVLKKGDRGISKEDALVHAFETYDSVHRERAQWLVRISRRQGELVKWEVPEIGGDWDRIYKDMDERIPPLLLFDWEGMIRQATDEFARRIHS
ncbi:hypothetical protein FOMA001_g13194 [Fusarium oxysporum f. sp. matthiolae]|nr:hypothetical protein FOMA001_g13194 [Fusarium oxysporum f. sp. matthiolae]